MNELSILVRGRVITYPYDLSIHKQVPRRIFPERTPQHRYEDTFEPADEREMWHDGNDGSRADFRPDGERAASDERRVHRAIRHQLAVESLRQRQVLHGQNLYLQTSDATN